MPISSGVIVRNHSGDPNKNWAVGANGPVRVPFIVLSSTFIVGLKITDVSGKVTACLDPVVLVAREEGKPVSETLDDLGDYLDTVTVMNGESGLKNLDIVVNGEKFKVAGLGDNEETTIDISSAMVEGPNNAITVTGYGKPGARAVVLIWDGGG